MKPFLRKLFLFLLAAVQLTTALASDEMTEIDECEAAYAVQLGATYPNGIAVQCSAEDMDLITEVIQSVVQIDSIASHLGGHIPQFQVVSQEVQENVTIDDTGDLASPPDAEEIAQHLTEEDAAEDQYYAHGVESNVGQRKLQQLIMDAKEHGISAAMNRPAKEADQSHRKAQLMNCRDIKGGCRAEWCCQICGVCWGNGRRRDQEYEMQEYGMHTLLRGTPTAPGTVIFYDDAFMLRVNQHEQRVSAEIEKRMRYMARQEVVPCLGNFWQLEVSFKLSL